MLLAAAGCGGGGGGGESDGGRLSKPELIHQADEICAESNAKNDTLRRRGPAVDPTSPNATPETRRRTAETLRAFATNVREEADELGGLRPPTPARAGFEEMIGRHKLFARHLEAAADAAEQNRRTKLISALSAAQRANPVNDPFPSEYGFQVCGRVPRQQAA